MRKINLLALLLTLFSTELMASDSSNKDEYLYLCAEKNDSKVYFIPSNHGVKFEDAFPIDVARHMAENCDKLIVESYSLAHIKDGVSDSEAQKIIKQNQNFGDYWNLLQEESLKPKGGFLNSGDPHWEIKNKDMQIQFKVIFDYLEDNFGLKHLKDYTQLKPGIAAAIYGHIKNSMNHRIGMDTEISSLYIERNLPVQGLETCEDVVQSMRIYTRSYDSIKDEFETYRPFEEPYSKTNYLGTLEKIEQEMKEDSPHILTDEHSLIMRNRKWVKKLNKISGQDTLVIVGQAHFPGEYGLINLMRQEVWKWYHVLPKKTPLLYQVAKS